MERNEYNHPYSDTYYTDSVSLERLVVHGEVAIAMGIECDRFTNYHRIVPLLRELLEYRRLAHVGLEDVNEQ